MRMDTNTVDTKVIELQRQVQKLEKLEKMINPNSKKSLILWEEDDNFKSLIASIVEYSQTCDTDEAFPVELLDKLNYLNETKEQIRVALNDLGCEILEDDTFRSYVSKINTLYSEYPTEEEIMAFQTIQLNNLQSVQSVENPQIIEEQQNESKV